MYTKNGYKKDNDSRAHANFVAQTSRNAKQEFTIEDNRPLSLKQRKLQQVMNNHQRVRQMVKWHSSNTTAAGALPAALNAGYVLASANPTAKPAMPAWVTARVQQENPWDPAAERAISDAKADTAWGNLPLAAHAHIPDEAAWKQNKSNQDYNNRYAVHQAQWPITAAAKWLNAKWNDGWNNDSGDLPGISGAAGYVEYYAAPTGVIGVEGFWGRNRILRNTGLGAYENNWWATDDHYDSFTRIT